jgi:hypothetical protein
LTRKSTVGKNPPVIKFSPEWAPQRDPVTGKIILEGRLWDYIERIAISRREGKNRRDSASVGTRVLTLVEKLGAGLFKDTMEKERLEVEEVEVVKKGRRRKAKL